MEYLWYKVKLFLVRFSHFKERDRIKRYGLPIALVLAVFLLKVYYFSLLGQSSSFLMVSFIVAVSAWYGGLGPGLFATILASIMVFFTYLLSDIVYHPLVGDLISLIIFIVEGTIISIASEARFQVENQKDEFIGFVAHELKNPLSSIIGFSGLITINAKKNGCKKISTYSREISTQSDRILEEINDLLDITRIEIGKFSYLDSFFNMQSLVEEVVAHQKIIARNRRIEFLGKSKKTIYADRYRIGQVITNLITNSLKYSPASEKILVRLKESKGNICISVQDFGFGIPKDEQVKIFRRFYRTNAVTHQSKSEGLGLGLYICNQIVTRHRGRLWVRSKEGEGSTFYLSLPVGVYRQKAISSFVF